MPWLNKRGLVPFDAVEAEISQGRFLRDHTPQRHELSDTPSGHRRNDKEQQQPPRRWRPEKNNADGNLRNVRRKPEGPQPMCSRHQPSRAYGQSGEGEEVNGHETDKQSRRFRSAGTGIRGGSLPDVSEAGTVLIERTSINTHPVHATEVNTKRVKIIATLYTVTSHRHPRGQCESKRPHSWASRILFINQVGVCSFFEKLRRGRKL